MTIPHKTWYSVATLIAALLLGVIISSYITPTEDGYTKAVIAAHTRHREATEAELAHLHREIEANSAGLTKTLTVFKHSVDTLMVEPKTAAETTLAISQLPQFRREALEAIQSCSEFQVTAHRYVSACDSTVAAVRVERDDWKTRYTSEHPSGVRRVWEKIDGPVFFIGGLYLGLKVSKQF